MRRVIPLIIAFIAALALAVEKACPSKVYYAHEVTSPTFRMEWEVRDGFSLENDPFDVVFKSAPVGSTRWKEITKSWTDEPAATPGGDCMRFINDRTGYLFYNEKYAVTTDGGQSWAVWDAKKEMRAVSCFIDGVRLESDGQGSMSLSCITHSGDIQNQLITNDFGRSWKPLK